ncbi:unnamed protein product [Plutella xylostella]|uniref:(diamondback moth) hypothetical protein n=1 Tax=Plutella xylostella TaxID=51655 RepID=A0A8S4EJV8_PLUXY|nr:unnamed protein product [Plutella xylostella]
MSGAPLFELTHEEEEEERREAIEGRDGILPRSSRSSAARTARSTPLAKPELHWSRNCVAAKICGYSIYS